MSMLQIVYSDAVFIAVDKPPGLLTVPGRGPDKQDCLYTRVLEHFPDARVVHRLDMGTSGLVLFARTSEAQRALSMQFEQRQIRKLYMAEVEGVLEADSGRIHFSLRKDMQQRLPPRHLVDCVRGKKALTRWRVLERLEHSTCVILSPRTGRSHQLRLHMQAIGHPIVGDPIYGTPANRLMLHASRLVLLHPDTKNRVVLVSKCFFSTNRRI